MTNLTLITPPAVEPVSLADLHEHARIDTTDEDPLYLDLIIAARKYTERVLQRALVTQTWELYLNEFSTTTRLPYSPLQSITSVKYVDIDGDTQTVDSSIYVAGTYIEPGELRLGYDQYWPTDVRDFHDVVIVRYVAGYGDGGEDVPEPLRRAICVLATTLGEYREMLDPLREPAHVPLTYHHLIADYRIYV